MTGGRVGRVGWGVRALCLALIFAALPILAQTAPEPAAPPAGGTPAAAETPGTPSDSTPSDSTPSDSETSDTGNPGYAELKVDLTPNQSVTVGDRVQADVVLVWMGPEPTEEPRFPAGQDTWGKAEILETGQVESFVDQSQRRIYRQTLYLTAFKVGDYRLPQVTVAVPLPDRTEELRTPTDLSFAIGSVLPDPAVAPTEDEEGADDEATAETLEPRPAAPLQNLDRNPLYLVTVALLAALIVLLAIQLARRMIRGGGASIFSKPRLPPLDELLERLRRLDAEAGSEPVHTGLSLALRDFLGRSLGIHALEATTSEIQRHLRSTDVPAVLAQRTVRLLRDCDQVKFARLEVEPSTADDRATRAQATAREIDELLRPEPEPEAVEA